MLSSESKRSFRLLRRCLRGLLLYDLRAVEARSVFLFLSVLGSRRIFGLTPNPAARLDSKPTRADGAAWERDLEARIGTI